MLYAVLFCGCTSERCVKENTSCEEVSTTTQSISLQRDIDNYIYINTPYFFPQDQWKARITEGPSVLIVGKFPL
jgi:hypothetical protein